MNRRLDLRLLIPALAAWAVTAAGVGWSINTRIAVGALAVGLALIATVSQQRLLALALVVTSALQFGCVLHELRRTAGPVGALARDHRWAVADVQLREEPRRIETGRAPLVLVEATVTSIAADGVSGPAVPVHTPVLLRADGSWSDVGWRDELRVRGRLTPATEPGMVAILAVRGPARPVGGRAWVLQISDGLRSGLREAMTGKPADAAGLVPALVVGDTSRSPPELTEAMRTAGLSHLSAVSGTNCAMVLLAVLWATRRAGLPRRLRPLVSAVALLGFVILARPEPSVLRAAVMGGVGLIALSRSRPQVAAPALGAAVIGLLLWDPWLSRELGFALSVTATVGLLVLAPDWARALRTRLPRSLGWLGTAVAVPSAAFATTAPLIVVVRSSVGLATVPANLLVEPVVAPTTLLGVAIVLVAPFSSAAASAVGWVAAIPASYLAGVAHLAAQLPLASLPWPAGPFGAALAAAVVVVLIFTGGWWVLQGRRHPLWSIGIAGVAAALALPTSQVSAPPTGWAMVTCDVGQGDALLLNSGLASGSKAAVLVDTGPDPAAIAGCLRRWQVDVLEAVIITHFHADHTGGLRGVLATVPVRKILTTVIETPGYEANAVAALARKRHLPLQALQAGDRFSSGALAAQVRWPARRITAGSIPNNGSLVLTASLAGVQLALLADIEREAGAALHQLAQADPRQAAAWRAVNVIKVAHHGSGNLDQQFLGDLGGKWQ